MAIRSAPRCATLIRHEIIRPKESPLATPTAQFSIAFDYDATALAAVKQFNIYAITNGQRGATPIATPTTVPTDAAPLILTGSYGPNTVEVVPVDLSGMESVNTDFFTVTLYLPAPTNIRRVK